MRSISALAIAALLAGAYQVASAEGVDAIRQQAHFLCRWSVKNAPGGSSPPDLRYCDPSNQIGDIDLYNDYMGWWNSWPDESRQKLRTKFIDDYYSHVDAIDKAARRKRAAAANAAAEKELQATASRVDEITLCKHFRARKSAAAEEELRRRNAISLDDWALNLLAADPDRNVGACTRLLAGRRECKPHGHNERSA